MLAAFERRREENRVLIEGATGETATTGDQSLLEFDKHSQTPNDAYALRIRLGILLRFLSAAFSVRCDKSLLTALE
jgi:hypothetical protein